MKCPAGHDIPNKTKRGECTPLYCAEARADGEKPKKERKKKDPRVHKSIPFTSLEETPTRTGQLPLPAEQRVELAEAVTEMDMGMRADVDAALTGEVDRFEAMTAAMEASKGMIGRAGTGLGNFAVRQAFLKIPKNMDNEKAEAWAQAKAVELLPTALGEVEFRLKFGSDDQRYEAAKDVLDMNGMRKRDAINSGGNTIILNLGPNGDPWAKKVTTQTVDAVLSKENSLPDRNE